MRRAWILAGGMGRRLGLGIPKAMARVGDATLLELALRQARGLADEVVVIAPRGRIAPHPTDVVSIEDPGQGPLVAIALAAQRVAGRDEVLLLAVDQPRLTAPALGALRQELRDSPAVVPCPGGVAQPLAAWYRGSALARLAPMVVQGESRLVPAVSRLDPRWIHDEELGRMGFEPDAFLNLNTPEDLRRVSAGLP